MSLRKKQFKLGQDKTHQAGVVLITGLIFMLIVTMACFATLENIRVFRVNDGEQLIAYSKFYQTESLLGALETRLLQTSFSLGAMNAFFDEQQIVDNSHKHFADAAATLWQNNMASIREQDGNQYLQEFLGFKRKPFLNAETNELQEGLLCIIRISVWQKDQPQYAIQSWLALVPEESKVQFESFGFYAKSRRIAWHE